MRELDALLLGWLDSQYAIADDRVREIFSELLEMQDPDIMRMINGGSHLGDTNLAGNSRFDIIIQQIRSTQPN